VGFRTDRSHSHPHLAFECHHHWRRSLRPSQLERFDSFLPSLLLPSLTPILPSDQITSGTLKFDSGNVYKVGSLPNAGTGLGVGIANETTSKLVFTVTGVSSTTSSAGLAEIAVYGATASSNSTANSTVIAANSTSSAAVSLSTQLSKLTDLAMGATVTASGYATGQGPERSIDGYVDGYKEDGTGSPYEVRFFSFTSSEKGIR
jgi:hypothetical protein